MRLLWGAAGLMLAAWAILLLGVRSMPLHSDALLTMGAGARLCARGHFACTYMLYGLVNPFLLELFSLFGAGTASFHVLRVVNVLIGAAGVAGIAMSYREVRGGSDRLSLLPVLLACAGSAYLLLESFEPTPETGTGAVTAWLLFACLRYMRTGRGVVLMSVLTVLLAGFRPTAILMALPVPLVIARETEGRTALRLVWRWALLGLPVACGLAATFLDNESFTGLAVLTLAALVLVTAACLATDARRRKTRGWRRLGMYAGLSLLGTFALFPHYFLRFGEMLRQMDMVYLSGVRELGDPGHLAEHLALSLLYLVMVFPGPSAAVGIGAFAGSLPWRRTGMRGSACLGPFLLGLLPALLVAVRDLDLQERYMMPFLPPFLLMGALGIRRLLSDRVMTALLGSVLLLSMIQLQETVRRRPEGGMLDALEAVGDYPAATVSSHNMGVGCVPEHYAEGDSVDWPLVPYAAAESLASWHPDSLGELVVCYGEAPSWCMPVQTWGVDYRDESGLSETIRSSRDPCWVTLWVTVRDPWAWRLWSRAALCERSRRWLYR